MLSFREYVLLRLLDKLQGDRTIRSAYHILTGKKSAQTIQDVKWYRLTNYYRMFPHWSLSSFEQSTARFKETGYIKEETVMYLSKEGAKCLAQLQHHYELPSHFNGWKYGEIAPLFWKRLSLFIQSLSYAEKKERYFLPVVSDGEVQAWVKRRWPREENTKKQWLQGLYEELYDALDKLSPLDASIFTFRLSGYKETGRTLQQLQETYHLDIEEVNVRFHSVLHYLMKQSHHLPFLSKFTKDLEQNLKLTTTATVTKQMLDNGLSLDDIAEKRRLKKSTIEDHLVEIASEMTNFPIHQYVSPHVKEVVLRTVQKQKTYRLKKIKQQLAEEGYPDISYFAIRLTLACDGGGYGNT